MAACGSTAVSTTRLVMSSHQVRRSRTLASTPLGPSRLASTTNTKSPETFLGSLPTRLDTQLISSSFTSSSTKMCISTNTTTAAFKSLGNQLAHQRRTSIRAATFAWYPVAGSTSDPVASSNIQYRRSTTAGEIATILAYVFAFASTVVASSTINKTATDGGSTKEVKHPTVHYKKGGGKDPRANTIGPTVSKKRARDDINKLETESSKNQYPVSLAALQGARWTMEDTFLVENGGRFLGVFDGHGGSDVSCTLQDKLFKFYLDELVSKHWEEQNEFGARRRRNPSALSHISALQRALEQVEDVVLEQDEWVYQGSTAVCVVLHTTHDGKRTLLSANVGDSRAIISRDGKALDLTRDHKPNDERERARIEAMGEEIEWDPYGQVYRVRDLSLSRAIGDRFAKPVVSSEAEIMTFPVTEDDDEFVLLASDGLWDVMTSQEVVDFVHQLLEAGNEGGTHSIVDRKESNSKGLVSGTKQNDSSAEKSQGESSLEYDGWADTSYGYHRQESYLEACKMSMSDKRNQMARLVANEALERGSADNVCVVMMWLDREH